MSINTYLLQKYVLVSLLDFSWTQYADLWNGITGVVICPIDKPHTILTPEKFWPTRAIKRSNSCSWYLKKLEAKLINKPCMGTDISSSIYMGQITWQFSKSHQQQEKTSPNVLKCIDTDSWKKHPRQTDGNV